MNDIERHKAKLRELNRRAERKARAARGGGGQDLPPYHGVTCEPERPLISKKPVQRLVRAVTFERPFHLHRHFGRATVLVEFAIEGENGRPLPSYYALRCLCSEREFRFMRPCRKSRAGRRSRFMRDVAAALEAHGGKFDPYSLIEYDPAKIFRGIIWTATVAPGGDRRYPRYSVIRRLEFFKLSATNFLGLDSKP